MQHPFPTRWRRALALGVVALPLAGLRAEEPDVPPVAPVQPEVAPVAPVRPTTRNIDVYYGTMKVGPVIPPPMITLVPIPQLHEHRDAQAPRVTDAVLDTLNAVRDSTNRVNDATADLLLRIGERVRVSPEPAPVVQASHSVPQPLPASLVAPWLVPVQPVAPLVAPAAAAAPQQPTVVVIRESSDSRPAPVEAPRGITLSSDTLLGVAVGVGGLGLGFAGWRRKRNEVAAAAVPLAMPAAPPPGDGVLLMGKYNAGKMPEPKERFEIGPSYQDQQREKKKVESENQNALVEFILMQNLALQTELGGPAHCEHEPETGEEYAPTSH